MKTCSSDVVAADQIVLHFSEYSNCQAEKTQRSARCVLLWPCLRVVLCSERWLLSALPVCHEHLDESGGRAARVDTANRCVEGNQHRSSLIR